MKWYQKNAAQIRENRIANELKRQKRSTTPSGGTKAAQRAAEIRENRILNELRRGNNRPYAERVQSAYDRVPFRRNPEIERPARPITVSSPVYKPRPMTPSDYKGGPIIDNKTGKPVNAPKGFSRAVKTFGTPKFPAAMQTMLRLNPFARYVDLLSMLFEYLDKRPKNIQNPFGIPSLPNGYSWCSAPRLSSGLSYLQPPMFRDALGTCSVTAPLANQSGAFNAPWNMILTRTRHSFGRPYQAGAIQRWVFEGAVSKPVGSTFNGVARSPYLPIGSVQNPNVVRHASGQPITDPTIRNVQNRMDKRQSDYIADRQIHAMARGLVKRQIPHARIPPERGSRENKHMSKLAKFGIALAKVMDGISEASEVIDAVYDALPQDVKDRWEKGVSYDYSVYDGVRQGDNYGQYGIDGADWKVRAIYYNWRKVDVNQAARNLIKNHVSDKIIGKYQSGMPVNIGNAVGSGEMEAAKMIDKVLDRSIDYIVNGR